MARCLPALLLALLAGVSARAGEDLDRLVERFRSGSRDDRIEAAKSLGRLGPEAARAVPVLVEALDGEDPLSRALAAEVLGRIGPTAAPAVPGLLRHVDSPDRSLRGKVLIALRKIGPAAAEAAPALRRMLRSETDAWFRRLAVEALGGIGPAVPETREGLVRATADADALVRREVLRALSGTRDGSVVPLLVKALEDPSDDVRWRAACELESFPRLARPAVPRLLELLREDPDCAVRAVTAGSLGAFVEDADTVVPALIAALADEARGVRRCSAQSLGDFGTRAAAAVPRLVERLGDDTGTFAAEALGKIGRGLPLLIEALEHESPWVRLNATEAIGGFGPAAAGATSALIRAARDEEACVRVPAIEALSKVAPPADVVLPVFLEALADEPWGARDAALDGLRRLGKSAEPAIPRLIRILGESHGVDWLTVRTVLARIGPASAARAADLAEILADPEQPAEARDVAGAYLRGLGPKARPVVPRLAKALGGPVPDLRGPIIDVLLQILTPADLPALAPLLAHEDEEVRRIAECLRDLVKNR